MSWRLKEKTKAFIAENVTSEMRKDGALDLKKLAEKIGISNIYLAEFSKDNVSGLLKKEGEQWNIYVNDGDSPRRRRFTIAHEIGHFISYLTDGESKSVLDKDGQITDFAFLRQEGGIHPMEAEANSIAAKLLMPYSDVLDLVAKGKTTEEMAEYFQVSEVAMDVRLRDLNVMPFESYGQSVTPTATIDTSA